MVFNQAHRFGANSPPNRASTTTVMGHVHSTPYFFFEIHNYGGEQHCFEWVNTEIGTGFAHQRDAREFRSEFIGYHAIQGVQYISAPPLQAGYFVS